MKKTLLILMFVITNIAFAQVVSLKENDRFTKKNVLQVNAMKGKRWKLSDDIAEGVNKTMYFSLKSVNNTNYLQLNTTTLNPLCLREESRAILLLSDNSTIELYNKSETECASANKSLTGSYLIPIEDITTITNKEIDEVRIYFSEGYSDFKINKNSKETIKETSKLFLSELATF